MDREELRQMARDTAEAMHEEIREAVAEGVAEGFTRVGIDVSNPIEMQKDMQWVRDWRQTAGAVRKKGLLTAAGILVAGVLGAVWLGLQELLS